MRKKNKHSYTIRVTTIAKILNQSSYAMKQVEKRSKDKKINIVSTITLCVNPVVKCINWLEVLS